MLETLVTAYLVYIAKMVLVAVVRQSVFCDIPADLIDEMVFFGFVAAPCVDVGVVVFLYQSFQPVPVHTTVVLLCDKVGDLLDVPVKVHPLLFRYQSHTWLVTLFLRAPVIGADGKLACRFYIDSANIPDTEIDTCQIRHIVLGRCLSDECRYFHIYFLLSLSFLPVFASCHRLWCGIA